MNGYERRALHASALALAAAALAYAASYVHEPGPDVAAVFGIAAVLLGAYHALGDPDAAAGAWLSPTGAAVLSVVADASSDLRLAALALAGLSVLGFVVYPLTASAARAVEGGDFLR
ncbi:hypothetical protein [Halobacterium sp. KA-6]|jgi:hypothetical protein|uniref:hypothetical protein n=1 Tax=Halobacterium sp. KA-6 TaxID=2896368 RepID=UPI001E5E3434|nr:hypothetical protein [Halobacterium sp. KA-6]MCD2203181.1 hypothetical protein [Halobacterium sp. KA-6]